MQPSNSIRTYEVIALILVSLNTAIAATLAGAQQLGITIPPLVALALVVASAVIPTILNRMDAFGAPQGNQILFNLPQSSITPTAAEGGSSLPPVVQQADVVIPDGTPRVDGEAGLVAQSKFRAGKRE